MKDYIVIHGAHENNLKSVSLKIPKGKIVVFTGVSGSGKSSLVFKTIATEAMKQLNDTYPNYIRSRLPHYESAKVDFIDSLTTTLVIDQKPFHGNGRSTVATLTDIAPLIRLLYSRCGVPSIGSSNYFSFNDSQGMCPDCGGLGVRIILDFEKILDRDKSLNQGAICFPGHQVGSYQWMLYANSGLFDPDKPLKQFSEREWEDLMFGSGILVNIKAQKGKGVWESYNLTYEGLRSRLERLYLKRNIQKMNDPGRRTAEGFTTQKRCESCNGSRLSPKALSVTLKGLNIHQFGQLEIAKAIEFIDEITDPIGQTISHKIRSVLENIMEMGLGYLHLNRLANTLSGGEAQRLKIVRHINSSLTGLTYIFDEPSIGLHPYDVGQLNRLLVRLRDRGNTILVVEHNSAVIRIADEIVELGPLAGSDGGELVFQGTLGQLLESDTLTAKALSKAVPVKSKVRSKNGEISIRNACTNNLKQVNVEIPLGVLTTVCGVAGSGKTSLVCSEIIKKVPNAVHINQESIGTSSRSTPATYIGIMDDIRRMFARQSGAPIGLFSTNSAGACPECNGKGTVSHELAFMDPITVTCELCQGRKFNENALSHQINGLTVLDVLNLTIDEASRFFQERKILKRLGRLQEAGLGYLTLGRETATLSGGECQRLKLAEGLSKDHGIYVMDEPTIGLHPRDIDNLMSLLDRMVDDGNTIILVEHDLSVIKRSDWVIELGPRGGSAGGTLIFEGTPEALVKSCSSVTASFLQES